MAINPSFASYLNLKGLYLNQLGHSQNLDFWVASTPTSGYVDTLLINQNFMGEMWYLKVKSNVMIIKYDGKNSNISFVDVTSVKLSGK